MPLLSALAAQLRLRVPATAHPTHVQSLKLPPPPAVLSRKSSFSYDAPVEPSPTATTPTPATASPTPAINECSHPPSPPPPAVALRVALALFLIDRPCASASLPAPPDSEPAASAHPVRARHSDRLAVTLDLRASPAVHAALEPLPATRRANAIPTDELSATVCDAREFARAGLAAASDMRARPRHVAVVTTAAVPWMTGTAVNPTLRAAYLARRGHRVALVLPWLDSQQQRCVFPKRHTVFATRESHAAFVRRWLAEQVPGPTVHVVFYDAVYSPDFGSILPVGAITDVFQKHRIPADVCILEEPEHLTWHHAGPIWTELFNVVVGIIHTNYIEYARDFGFFGPQKALALLFLNLWVCRGYCHRIIKLSDAVQDFPNSVTSNVHGVRDNFIAIGRTPRTITPFHRGAYFMAKVLWAKGYRDLIDNIINHHRTTGHSLPIDLFGTGPDAAELQAEIAQQPALSAVSFDACVANHTGPTLQAYKVFVNASRSDVVCTATAEALAMGKLVVCLEHPSNDFFATFPNCITYRTTAQFARAINYALSREPTPLSAYDAYRLGWDAATDRLYDAMRLPPSKTYPSMVGQALASAHATLSKIYPQPGMGIHRAMSRDSL